MLAAVGRQKREMERMEGHVRRRRGRCGCSGRRGVTGQRLTMRRRSGGLR